MSKFKNTVYNCIKTVLNEEKYINNTISLFKRTYGPLKNLIEQKEKQYLLKKCISDLIKNKIYKGSECCSWEYPSFDNPYKMSKYLKEDANLFKNVLTETLTGKNPRLDAYYQTEINKYYVHFINLIESYPRLNGKYSVTIVDPFGIMFKINEQIFCLFKKGTIKNTYGRYDEGEGFIYLFLLSDDITEDKISNNDKKECLSDFAQITFFHEMTHKLDSEAIKGNNKNATLRSKKAKSLEQKRNTDGEFNAILSMIIRMIENDVKKKTKDYKGKLTKEEIEEYLHKQIIDLINNFKNNIRFKDRELNVLSSLYNDLNETNKNRLINSLQTYFSETIFDRIFYGS